MAKQQGSTVVGVLAWFTGVVVSLVVGNAMIQGILTLPVWLGGGTTAGNWIAMAIGWIVVITTLVGAVMAVIKK
jgi:hypothetical protein